VPRAGRDQLKSLVVVISADFAFRHVAPLLTANQRGSSLAQRLPLFPKIVRFS
jgi:hypothetical protein